MSRQQARLPRTLQSAFWGKIRFPRFLSGSVKSFLSDMEILTLGVKNEGFIEVFETFC